MQPNWVKTLILDTIDVWQSQDPESNKEEMLEYILEENEAGENILVGSKKANTVFMFQYSTPWVATVHMFSKHDSAWDVIKVARKTQDYIFNNTEFHRLEIKAHVKSMCKLVERIGWTLEGTHPAAIKLEDGTLITEYSYGLVK